jgi:hypothetical protein
MLRQQTWQGKLKNSDRRRWSADVGIASAISKPGACARRHVHSFRLRLLVAATEGDSTLL